MNTHTTNTNSTSQHKTPIAPADLVRASDHKVEQRDDGSLELGPSPRVDRRRRKRLPDNRLADVRRDKQGDSRTQAVTVSSQTSQENEEGRISRHIRRHRFYSKHVPGTR